MKGRVGRKEREKDMGGRKEVGVCRRGRGMVMEMKIPRIKPIRKTRRA